MKDGLDFNVDNTKRKKSSFSVTAHKKQIFDNMYKYIFVHEECTKMYYKLSSVFGNQNIIKTDSDDRRSSQASV